MTIKRKFLPMFGDEKMGDLKKAFIVDVAPFLTKDFVKTLEPVYAFTVDTDTVPRYKGEKAEVDLAPYYDDAQDVDDDLELECRNPELDTVEVRYDTHKGNKIKLNAREEVAIRSGIMSKSVASMTSSLGRTLVKDCINKAFRNTRLYSGVLDSLNPRDFTDLTNAEEVLSNEGNIYDSYKLIMTPKTKNNLKVTSTDGKMSDDKDLVKYGVLDERNGFKLYLNVFDAVHKSGTAHLNDGIKVKSSAAIGEKTITLTGLNAGETLVDADMICMPNGINYTVNGNHEATGTDLVVNLIQAVDSEVLADMAITIPGDHRKDLALHETAILFSLRPFEDHNGGDHDFASTIIHPETGIPLTFRHYTEKGGLVKYWRVESLYTVVLMHGDRIVRMGGH